MDIGLTHRVVSRADDRTVGAQTEGVGRTRGDCDNVVPTADIALPVAVVAGCQDISAGRDPYGVIAACCHCHRALPAIDLARSHGPVPGGYNAPIVPETDGVQISGRNCDEITPILHSALLSTIGSDGLSCAIRSNSD